MAEAGQHKRTSEFILAPFERWALPRLAAALPQWVVPDHLTVLGLIASTAIAAAYMASNRNPAWLWLANAALAINWFGDSLDGTLARFRKTERPRYGFYLDHLTDAYSTLAIGIGLGLSPYMLLSAGLAISVGYLVMSINVYLETHVFGEFSIGYGRLGPTEVRVLLMLLNTVALLWGPMPFGVLGFGVTAFDLFGLFAVGGMFALLSVRIARNLRRLARLEPPRTKRQD